MIYVPDLGTYQCYEVLNKDTIRAYKENPNTSLSNSIEYRDYFINSHYIFTDNTLIKEESTIQVNCISTNDLTDAYIYRNDIAHILIITLILIGVTWFLVVSLIKALFKGRKVF